MTAIMCTRVQSRPIQHQVIENVATEFFFDNKPNNKITSDRNNRHSPLTKIFATAIFLTNNRQVQGSNLSAETSKILKDPEPRENHRQPDTADARK
jgi:hypothetical protein